MATYNATVSFNPLRSALVNLPSGMTSMLFNSNIVPQNVVLELVWQRRGIKGGDSKAYVGWTGMTSSTSTGNKEGLLEVDPTFALTIGIESRQKVTINVKVNSPQAHTVHLEPVDASDWEIVEIHAGFLESWMINQVRAVSTLHPITVYPSATSIASLKVVKIEPDPQGQFAQLSPDSEVVIAPKVRKKPTTGGKKKLNGTKAKKPAAGLSTLLRGITLPNYLYPDTDEHALIVYGDNSLRYLLNNPEYVNVSVVKPASVVPKPESPEELTPAPAVVAKLVIYNDGVDGHVGVSFAVASALSIAGEVGDMVRLESVTTKRTKPGVLTLHPYTTSSAPASLKFGEKKDLPIESIQGPITHRMQLAVQENLPYGALVEFESGEDGWMETHGQIKLGSELVKPESQVGPSFSKPVAENHQRRLVGVDKQLAIIKASVKESTGGGLVYGGRGCGKTAVLKEIQQDLHHNLIHTVWFSCGVHGEKQLQYLKDTISKLFMEAAWYAPSVIILDDIDKLMPAEQEHRDSSKSVQLAEIFKQQAAQIMASRPVSILASTSAMEALNGLLVSGHVFDNSFHLKSPDRDVRDAILKEAVGVELDFDLIEVAGSTEGYQPSDLWVLAERANHESILRRIESENNNTPTRILQQDFDKAMEDYVPASLRGVKLQKSSTSWTDIGGLKETKQVLLETLEWPTKYAPIFASCPLRLRSGLLLYGYPGCGKTLLASAVAGQCGLNFISIKGPEILNKYIGASEQSVRELFERAQAAKPCILFFDEFDSIAPKRGHDSTGVTDRVVNQMLTQMDGAEGLDGVYVLAATSRPDLIDSALLRPGRLDKSLICDMPNVQDRLSILEAIRTKMTISKDVDLLQVAERTDGFSGADLQALMYNAYLDAIHEVIDMDGDEPSGPQDSLSTKLEYFQIDSDKAGALDSNKSAADRARAQRRLEKMLKSDSSKHDDSSNSGTDDRQATESQAGKVQISWQHLETSLRDTNPSISTHERRKLQAVYDQFSSGRDGNMPDGTASNDIGGRTTLA